MPIASRRQKRGFALLTTAVCLVAMVGALGLSVDISRMYIVRNEMQGYLDAAALSAAIELDGTAAGIARAESAVTASVNRWNMGTAAFGGTQTDFSASQSGAWSGGPSSVTGVRFVRVQATANLSLYFIPAVSSIRSATVNGSAVAGQVPKTYFSEGMLPFSPLAHDAADPNFGYTVGERYTLRWGSNPMVGPNLCAGDNEQIWVDKAGAGNASERGFIEETSADIVRAAIEQDYQTRTLAVGDTVVMSGGIKQTQLESLINRINQDTDNYSATFAGYLAADQGNGRRLVAVPINTWYPDYTVVGFAAFFLLLPSEYPHGGNKSLCAEFVGPYVQGSRHPGAGGTGAYSVRLVQ